jgi:hypothetical protein
VSTLLTQIQICRRLGISDETWRRWRVARRVPAPVPNVPGRPRWTLAAIQEFEAGMGQRGGRRAYFQSARRARLTRAVVHDAQAEFQLGTGASQGALSAGDFSKRHR